MFISCDYNDNGKTPEEILKSYKGFKVSDDYDNETVFMSGNPVKDFEDATEYIAQQSPSYCRMSSSVDNFVSDCDGIFSWYTTASGCEMFDLAEKAEELDKKHQQARENVLTNASKYLQSLGVPEHIANRDVEIIYQDCSLETFFALGKCFTDSQNSCI